MLYVLCISVVLLLSFAADRSERKILLFFCAMILSLFCGFRGVGIGVDTEHYFKYMSYIRDGGVMYGSDVGFSAISYILMELFDNPFIPLILYATVTNYLIVFRLWDFRKESSLPLMLLMYMVLYYPYSFNIVRQFLAISIVFWATRFIERKQVVKYVFANIIACTIHASSLVCFSFLFYTFGKKTESNLYKAIGFVFAVFFIAAGLNLFSGNINKYEGYFAAFEGSVHAITLVKILCLGIIAMLNRGFGKGCFSLSKYGKAIPMQQDIPKLYATGLCLSALGMFFPYMNRIGFYFIMYEMPFWGQAIRAITDRYFYKMTILIIIAYVLIVNIMADENAGNLFYYQSFFLDENK